MSTSLTLPAEVRSEGRLQMLWDLSSLAFGRVLSVVLGFVAFAYLARTLSPESYGLVEYVVGLAALAAIVIEGGMGTLGTLAISRDRTRAHEFAGRIPVARFLVALVVVPLVGLSAQATGFDSSVAPLFWLFAFSLFAIPFKQDWLLQGLEKMAYVAPAQALKSGVFMIGVLVAVRGPADLARVGLVEVGAALLGAVYFVVVQRATCGRVALDVRVSRAWPLIWAGTSIGASNLVWPFITYAPMFLLTNLAESAQAAWLGGAQRIVVALVSFSGLYFFNLYPLMARGVSVDRAQWGRLMGSSVRVIAWASIGLALAITICADTIVMTVFGAPFSVAAPVLSVYIWMLPIRLLSGHARWTLLAAERQGALLLAELVCAATLVAFSVAFIPRYGAQGAAFASVLGNVIGWIVAHVFAERYVGPLPRFWPVLLPTGAAVIGGGVARLVGGTPALSLGIAIGTYALCMRLTAPGLLTDAIQLAFAKGTSAES